MDINKRVSRAGRCCAISAAAALCASAWSAPALAQDAGAIIRDERERAQRLLEQRPEQVIEQGRPVDIDREEAQPAAATDGGPSYLIEKIEIDTPPAFLPAEIIAEIIARYEGRRLTLGEIAGLTREFDDAYVKAGFKAGFAIVPEQDLTGGTLKVMLIEPRVDRIQVTGLRQVQPNYVWNRIPLREGQPLDLSRLERNLNLLNRTSRGGLQLEALLSPGGAFGTTLIDLQANEPPPVEFVTGIDNFGTEATGEYRGMAIMRANNLTGRDDPLQVGGSTSRDSLSGFASYSTPIVDFWRLNASGSISDSTITGGDLADLDLVTDSKFATASVEHPIFTTERWFMKGEAGGAYEISNTETGPLLIERRISEAFAQANLNYYGDTSGILSTLRYGVFEARIEDNAEVTEEWYDYFLSTLFLYKRWDAWEVRVRAEGQWSPDDGLPTTKQFSLGGPYSVRGYESSEFSGDSGFYLGIDLRKDLYRSEPGSGKTVNALTGVVFADGGGVFPFRAGDPDSKREDFATSVGTGFELFAFSNKLNMFVGVAMPLDEVHEPIHSWEPRPLFSLTYTQPLN